jgi:PTS system mannitol-specific IIA component
MAEITLGKIHSLLPESSMILNATAVDRDDAITQAGEALVRAGAVDSTYIAAMIERDHLVSTYVGDGIAMPHGTLTAKDDVLTDALVLLRLPAGVEWNGEHVTVVIGIAARHRRYIALISQLAAILLDPARVAAVHAAQTPEDVYALFDTKTAAH